MGNLYILRKGVADPTDLKDVTATAAELNTLSGITAKVSELNLLDGQVADAVMTVSAETTNVVSVGIQLNDAEGNALAVRGSVLAYLSDDANGDSIATTAPDGGVAIDTDGLLIPIVANKAFQLVSEADGDIDLTVTETGDATWYLIIVLPTGLLLASDAITMAAA